MYCCYCHNLSYLVIVNDLYVSRPRGFLGPFEAHPPLVIDPYAVLPFAFSFQGFKAIAGQTRHTQHRGCGFNTIEFQPGRPFNTEERLDSLSPREVSRALVPVAEDHNSTISHCYALRQT